MYFKDFVERFMELFMLHSNHSLFLYIIISLVIHSFIIEFDVRSSVHLGNVYVRLKVQLDAHGFFIILISISL
jgi:hypothetical protein